MNKYFDYNNILSYICYLIKCNILFYFLNMLIIPFFKYFKYIIINIKCNDMNNIVNQLNIYNNNENNLICDCD